MRFSKPIKLKPPIGRQPNRNHPLMRGLVGWWLLNEGGGLKAYDLSGKGNHGTLTGGPTWAGGRNGAALSLDGSDDYVDTADYSFSASQPFTFAGWINPSNVSGNKVILSKPSLWEYSFRLTNNNLEFIYWDTSGIGIIFVSAAAVVSAGVWQHIAVTFDGSRADLYVNNVLVASDTSISGTLQNRSNNMRIGHGYYGSGSSYYFQGKIDDFRIYDRALSPAELLELTQNPYAMFEQKRRLGFVAAAAPASTFIPKVVWI
jgi:hypothetical protein